MTSEDVYEIDGRTLDLSQFDNPEIVREILDIFRDANAEERRAIQIELDPVLNADVVE